ncbi:MAG: hypothetical protein FWF86_03240 [Clostridia bacterium]|nr:hypothetical protein [Clostridia bacterium]
MKRMVRLRIAPLLLFVALAASSCHPENTLSKLETLANWLREQGYDSTYTLLAETDQTVDMPIVNESAWYLFRIENEMLYVYFDTSNRAKQLAGQFFSDAAYGRTVAFRLRFIVNYRGEDEEILGMLDNMERQ